MNSGSKLVTSLVGVVIALVFGGIGAGVGLIVIEALNGHDESIINVLSVLGFVGAATGAFTLYEKLVGEDSIF